MRIDVEDAGPCRKKLNIEIPTEQVRDEYESLLKDFHKSASIPGFRPGRAPRDIVERRYGKAILNELRDRLVGRSYRQALAQGHIDALAIMDLREPVVAKDQPLVFSVTVDVSPVFDLPTYQGIPLKDEQRPVPEEEVDRTIERLRAELAAYEDVRDRAVEEHDMVLVDFEGTLDGKPLEEQVPAARGLGQARDFWLNVEKDGFLDPLGPALEGAKIGDVREARVPFGEGFTIAELAGREALYRATVKGIRMRILPDPQGEAFLKAFNVESPDGLRKRIREDLEAANRSAENRRRQNEIARYLLDRVPMDLPQSLVTEQTQRNIYNIVRENTARGVEQKEIVEHKEHIFRNAQRSAEDSLKLRYILHRIADEERITVAPAEVDAEIQYLAARWRVTPKQARAELEKRHGIDDIREDLKAGKAMEFLLKQAKVD